MAIRGKLRLLLGALRLGYHLRGLAPFQPRLRHCSWSILELDVKFYCRSNHA